MAHGISKERTPFACLCPALLTSAHSLSNQAVAEGRNPKEMTMVGWASIVPAQSEARQYIYIKKLYVCIQSNTFKTIVLILIILQENPETVKLS